MLINHSQPPLRGAKFLLAYARNMFLFLSSMIVALVWPKHK